MELIPSASVSAAEAVHFHSLLRDPFITLQAEQKKESLKYYIWQSRI